LFGYIRIYKDELKVKEYNLFKAYYCGVCQALKKEYGFPARYFLSYDAAFLAVLLSSVQEDDLTICPGRCMANPTTKRGMVSLNPVLCYAAAVNVLLVWFKLLDDWQDNHSIKALLLMPLMHGKKKKAQKRYPALCKHISEALAALSTLEKEKTPQADLPAAAFGALMAGLFDTELAGSKENRRIMSHAGNLLGRLIYLLDAWEDRAQNEKDGSYNPFVIAPVAKEDIKLTFDYMLCELSDSLSLLTYKRNEKIIENVVYLGLKQVTDSVLLGRDRKKEKRHERPI